MHLHWDFQLLEISRQTFIHLTMYLKLNFKLKARRLQDFLRETMFKLHRMCSWTNEKMTARYFAASWFSSSSSYPFFVKHRQGCLTKKNAKFMPLYLSTKKVNSCKQKNWHQVSLTLESVTSLDIRATNWTLKQILCRLCKWVSLLRNNISKL